MTKENEINNGREIYKAFKNILEQSGTLSEALDKCGYESYVWDEYETHNDTATTYNINLIGLNATINVIVDVYRDNGKMDLDEHFELVSRESDDWDGLYYGLD